MEQKIIFRTILELIGRPKEHIDKTMKDYVAKIKSDKEFKVLHEELADIKKQEKEELWATFAELEVEAKSVTKMTQFCFDYMPSIIEILDPAELKFSGEELSIVINDLQSKLHAVDMVAKQIKTENDFLKKNTSGLLKNYLTILLRGREGLTSQQLSELTGVQKDKLEDYLDQLIDEGKVDLKAGLYLLKK